MILQAINSSIRTKVIVVVLVTTFVALLVSTLVLLSYEIESYREFSASDLTTQADILARTTAPSLAFNDPAAAAATLALLENHPGILAAAIYTPEGELFATYGRNRSTTQFPPHSTRGGPQVAGNNLTLFHPIVESGTVLGTVYLQARYELVGRVKAYLLILGSVMLVSLLVAAFISVWLQGSVTNPLLAVTNVARNIIEQRNFSLRAHRKTDDEIGVLVDAFNAMLAEVGNRTEALETANRQLQQETDERRSVEGALRLADQRKDEFLATLAHELRNPLAPMVNALGLLGSPRADATVTQRAYGIMERQLAHMVRLVDDLLDVSRITRGKLVVRKQPVELADIVQSAVDTIRPLLEASHHKLALDLPQQPIYLQADPVRLSQVFSNLLNNSAKYTEAGGHISLTATVVGSMVRVVVADDGIGISAAALPSIFQMFMQGDSSAERTQAGLGVGLALARQLVELHGGSIDVHSPGPSKGSAFTVTLPLMAALTSQRTDAPIESEPSERRRHRILLVDDNVDFAASLALLLQGMGHEIRVAHDATAALATAAEFRPEFAFLDIGLPVVNGYELARRLRSLSASAETVLIAVSGWGQEQDRSKAEHAGFRLHLVKPVEFTRIQAVLESLAAGR
ncbi:MAG TPA: ATP-binding protein [Gammaproteobacteria bacterium]|nr:ATP-binding protein [Gammaproteobacteria bacterium]